MTSDWTPRRYKDRYCSPACGLGCTKAAYEHAVKSAAALADRLGDGWEPVVHENLGWFWSAAKGNAQVSPNERQGKVESYWCSIMTATQFCATAETPEDALGFAIQDARTAAQKIAADCAALSAP